MEDSESGDLKQTQVIKNITQENNTKCSFYNIIWIDFVIFFGTNKQLV